VHPAEVPRRPGRPRDARADAAILDATLDLVAEAGLAGLTIDAVAARAACGKATIYRRWSSKEELVLDAWMSCVVQPDLPDTGTLRGDLEALYAQTILAFGTGPLGRLLPQMVAAARTHDDLAEVHQRFVATRRQPGLTVLSRAQERGELPPGTDLDVVHDCIVGPIFYRILLSGGRVDATVLGQVLDVVLAGITAARETPGG
jgi:AcrR family transcriptional regulator